MNWRRGIQVAPLIDSLFLLNEILLTTLLLPGSHPFLLLLSLHGVLGRFILTALAISCGNIVVIHRLALLAIIVATLIFDALPLVRILLVLRLQVALKLAELGLDLVLTILADHFDRS